MDSGVAEDHIIEIALDDRSNKELRDPDVILKFIKESIKDKEDYYIILDEVQYLDEFEDVLNSLLHIRNADVYVTGSNSKFLSSDVITQFRGRGDEIRVYPLSFSEYVSVYQGSQDEASVKNKNISDKTIKNYIDYLIDSYLISKADRYDIKGKKHIGKLSKYYFEDVGLRNARLGFRQIEETHLMENIIYNELRVRGYHVDVGVVEYYETKADGKRGKKQLEVDFVATKGSEKYYIRSAFALPTADKVNQEQRGLLRISDFFRKIVVVGDNIKVRRDENGIITIGLRNFLLDENSLKL